MGVCVFTWVQIYMLVEQRDHKCVALVWDICLNSSSLAIYENYSHIIGNHKFTWLIYEICFVGSSTISGDSTFQSILDDGEPNEDDESCATIDGSCITIDED